MRLEPPPHRYALQLRQIHKQFPGRPSALLDGIDLAVAPGESIAILGESGSGKSTLLNIAAGLEAPDQGTVILNGVTLDLSDDSRVALARRQHLGFVFQAFLLLPYLNALENVRLPLRLLGMRDTESHERAMALMDSVGVATRALAMPSQLSGGETQRVAVARAVAHRPAVVFADEPTGNLDEQSALKVLELLFTEVHAHEAALVLVTHSKATASLASRIAQLHNGQLIES
jgi:putative ABC transport system ATP-binding protein